MDETAFFGLVAECFKPVEHAPVVRLFIRDEDKGPMRRRRLKGKGAFERFAERLCDSSTFQRTAGIEKARLFFLGRCHGTRPATGCMAEIEDELRVCRDSDGDLAGEVL
ncbi:MAG TPA: hypothetical protein DHU26_08045 [Spirochaetaceae bacterium]|nr:hypothetical protein [Spirochaetaceae bacterium]